MNYNTDGYTERTIYVMNSNDKNKKINHDVDNSLLNMKINENKPNIETVKYEEPKEVSSNKNNILHSSALRNVNNNQSNKSLTQALNRNMFKR